MVRVSVLVSWPWQPLSPVLRVFTGLCEMGSSLNLLTQHHKSSSLLMLFSLSPTSTLGANIHPVLRWLCSLPMPTPWLQLVLVFVTGVFFAGRRT